MASQRLYCSIALDRSITIRRASQRNKASAAARRIRPDPSLRHVVNSPATDTEPYGPIQQIAIMPINEECAEDSSRLANTSLTCAGSTITLRCMKTFPSAVRSAIPASRLSSRPATPLSFSLPPRSLLRSQAALAHAKYYPAAMCVTIPSPSLRLTLLSKRDSRSQPPGTPQPSCSCHDG